MASFLDNVPKFNPYIEQLPIDTMAKVGMEKQKRYDEGVQKIQQKIDAVGGLQVTKDSERAYLQSKLNNLTNNLKTFAASDFSDYQLVNSVTGMTENIASDPIIQTAVSSTMTRGKEVEYMEEARKKGELTPQNETYFKERDSAWLNNSELGQSYNAKYIPYVDRFKLAKEKFDALKIDEFQFDDIYKKGADGQYVTDGNGNLIANETMTRMKQEGYLPAKLEAAIDEIFNDPKIKQQLIIDSEYNYKNVTPEQLVISVTADANKIKDKLENKINNLNLRLAADPDNEELKKQIEDVRLAVPKVSENLQEMANLISTNPEAVKLNLFSNKEKEKYTAMFNVSKKSEELMSNPLWEAKFKVQQEATKIRQWEYVQAREAKEFELNYEQKERHKTMDYELAKLKALKGTKAGESEDPNDMKGPMRPSTENEEYNTVAFHNNKVDTAKDNYNTSQDELIWNAYFDTNSEVGNTNRSKLVKLMRANPDISKPEAIKRLLTQVATSKNKKYDDYVFEMKAKVFETYGDPKTRAKLQKNNNSLYESFNNFQNAELLYDNELSLDNDVKKSKLADFYNKLEKVPFKEKQVKIDGKVIDLTKQDGIDLAIVALYDSKPWITKAWGTKESEQLKIAYDSSKERLIRQGKEPLLNSFLNANTPGNKKQRDNPRVIDEYIGKPLIDGIERLISGPTQEDKKIAYDSYGKKVYGDVFNIIDNINPETLVSDIESTAKAIRAVREKNPTSVREMATGNDAFDKASFAKLKGVVAEYQANTKPMGVDADDFIEAVNSATSLEDFRNLGILERFEDDGKGNMFPALQIGKTKLYLNSPESQNFGLNSLNAFDNDYVLMTKSKINSNVGYSSVGNIRNKETYINNDVVMNNSNFPLLHNSSYVAKVNFEEVKGQFRPYIYIDNGKTSRVVEIPLKSDNLGKLMMKDLPEYISPKTLEQLLNY